MFLTKNTERNTLFFSNGFAKLVIVFQIRKFCGKMIALLCA